MLEPFRSVTAELSGARPERQVGNMTRKKTCGKPTAPATTAVVRCALKTGRTSAPFGSFAAPHVRPFLSIFWCRLNKKKKNKKNHPRMLADDGCSRPSVRTQTRTVTRGPTETKPYGSATNMNEVRNVCPAVKKRFAIELLYSTSGLWSGGGWRRRGRAYSPPRRTELVLYNKSNEHISNLVAYQIVQGKRSMVVCKQKKKRVLPVVRYRHYYFYFCSNNPH